MTAYLPTKRPKRPADWKPPQTDHEEWADELTYGPRAWLSVREVVIVGSICAAIALMAVVAWA